MTHKTIQTELEASQAKLGTPLDSLRRLQALTAALAAAQTADEVAHVAVSNGIEALGAYAGALFLFAGDRQEVTLFKQVGYPPELARRMVPVLALDTPWPLLDAVRRQSPVLIESPAEYARRYPEVFAPGSAAPSPAVAIFPLLAKGECLGALGFSFAAPRPFDRETEELLLALAGQCALALQRAQFLDREQAARARADRFAARAQRLQELTAELAEVLEPEQVAAIVVGRAVDSLHVHNVAIWLVDDTGSRLDQLRAHNYPAGQEHRFRSFPVDATIPIAEAVRSGQAVWLQDRAEYARRFPESEARTRDIESRPDIAIACLPLRAQGRSIGVLAFTFVDARRFDENERTVLTVVAHHCAQALMRARLYRAEQAARMAAEAERQRATFKAEALALLASSINFETTLHNVAQLAVPTFADWCGVDLVLAGQVSDPVVVFHRDPRKVELARELRRNYPPDPDAPRGLAHVLRAGQPELYEDIPDELLVQGAGDERHLVLLRQLALCSLMIVPMITGGRTIGAISFAYGESGRHYTRADLEVVSELAAQAAAAIENARLYRRLQEAIHRKNEADRRKDEFLAMLGHELRNPLSPILLALEVMELRGDATSRRERDIIRRQAQHLTRLVDDLLDISRITRGKIELEKEPLELFAVITKAIEMASPLLEQRSHFLAVDVPRQGMRVEADPVRLAQVFSNLLTNAAKYTDPGGHICIRAGSEGETLVVEVEDDGMGIPAELLPNVFELFVQSKRTLDRAQGGLGLGLALVRSLTQLHGGTVSAHSKGPGQGSKFTVRLPALASRAAMPEPAAQAPELRVMSSREDGKRVLVVDDNPDAAETLADIISALGHQALVAHDGPQALAMVQTFRPDIALLDIGLPVMDGYELASKLRERYAAASLVLVAVTGYGQESDRMRSMEAGFHAHLVKPVDFTTLSALLDAPPARPEPHDAEQARRR